MFKEIFNKKYYLPFVTFIAIVGCGGTSGTGNDNIVYSVSQNRGQLTDREKETLSELNAFPIYQNNTQDDSNSSNQLDPYAKALLDAINKERASTHTCGDRGTFGPVHPLVWNANLHASALEHAIDLAVSDTFSHDGSGTASDITGDGQPSKFYERIVRNGYTNYYSVGENIAGGQRTLDDVMRAWMASPGHCENIMKSTYTEVGVAIVKNEDSTYQIYWVQNFGSKKR